MIFLLLMIENAVLLLLAFNHEARIRQLRRILAPYKDMSEAEADDSFWSAP